MIQTIFSKLFFKKPRSELVVGISLPSLPLFRTCPWSELVVGISLPSLPFFRACPGPAACWGPKLSDCMAPCRPLFSILVIAKINHVHVRGKWFIISANIGWRKSNLYACAEFRSHFSTKKHLPTHTCIMRSVILKFPSVCGESFEKCMFVRYCYIVYSLPLKKDCGTPSIRRTYVRHTDHFDHLRNTSYLEHNYMYDYTTN